MRSARWKQTTTLAALVTVFSLAPAVRAADSTCSVSGRAQLDRNTELYSEATGGKAVANFTGTAINLTATFPSSSGRRARVSTSGFRLDGYVRTADIPVHTSRSVPVVAGHVWIAAHREVEAVDARGDKLKIKKELTHPLQQTFETWASCDALTLTEQVPQAHQPDGHARGYVLKKSSLELFSGPRGSGVTTVHRAPNASGVLFFSTERRSGWVHVQHHGHVILDAWAKARDLKALPPGETMDQVVPSAIKHRGSPQLKLQGEPRLVKAKKPVTIRGRASDEGAKIGRIEKGTVVYVVDVVAGWASVMPKDLSIAPAKNTQFWVKSSELEQ